MKALKVALVAGLQGVLVPIGYGAHQLNPLYKLQVVELNVGLLVD